MKRTEPQNTALIKDSIEKRSQHFAYYLLSDNKWDQNDKVILYVRKKICWQNIYILKLGYKYIFEISLKILKLKNSLKMWRFTSFLHSKDNTSLLESSIATESCHSK